MAGDSRPAKLIDRVSKVAEHVNYQTIRAQKHRQCRRDRNIRENFHPSFTAQEIIK